MSTTLSRVASHSRASRKTSPMFSSRDTLSRETRDGDLPEMVSGGRLLHLFDDAPEESDAGEAPNDFSDLALEVGHVRLFED